MQELTATYSPEDNKLRLYSFHRLDAETFLRVKQAGFKWAPRQEVFVAPMWTPGREDLLLDLCGEIGDDDSSLMQRAAERSDRFEEYGAKRAMDAKAAHQAVSAITEGILLGQPILVGHHSERRARKDAERIERGMERAVRMWETSEYWKRRADAAIRHAEYKEIPAVRHRRIRGLESDKRKQERNRDEAEKQLAAWSKEGITHEQALEIAGYCSLQLPRKEGDKPDFNLNPSAYDALSNNYPNLYAPRSLEEVIEAAKKQFPRRIAHAQRWIAHYENRIAYERAMLGEQGGLVAEKHDIKVGGRVLCGGEWLVVLRVNKSAGQITSVTTNAKYCRVRGIADIKDYQPPTDEDAAKAKKATKLPPLANYPGNGFASMTKAEFDRVPKDYRTTRRIKGDDTGGDHRVRSCVGCYCFLSETDFNERHRYFNVFITDAKRVDVPPVSDPVQLEVVRVEQEAVKRTVKSEPDSDLSADIKAMRKQLKEGVKVVSAPQLFPTPPTLAARMVKLANISNHTALNRVLEPSAGTGNILRAIGEFEAGKITAIEANHSLCISLQNNFPQVNVWNIDFLQFNTDYYFNYDYIIMNPPFANGDDIKHIKHAFKMLCPGGRLVAICANGPRQNEQLKPMVEDEGGTWEVLPPNTFAESGTSVSTVLICLDILPF